MGGRCFCLSFVLLGPAATETRKVLKAAVGKRCAGLLTLRPASAPSRAMSRATLVNGARLPLGEPPLRPSFRRERRALKRGIWPVAGCDEAGRGPLAGPVVAAAVVLDPERIPRGLDDSKKLDPPTRERLYAKICASAEV